MKPKFVFVSVFLLLAFLGTACKAETVEPTPNIAGTAAAMAETIVAVQLTKIAQSATATPTPTPELTRTPTPTLTFALPTLYPTQKVGASTCLLAHMVSETIPDNTEMGQGEFFEKTWDLQNVGTCTWTNQFSVVFHHGDQLGAPGRIYFPGTVKPGESFTLRIPMIVPAIAGDKLGFWNLESATGQAFGTTTSGLFWVKIVVEELGIAADDDTTGLTDSGYLYDLWTPISAGSVVTTGEQSSNISVGDTKHDYSRQGFVTFDLISIPLDATVQAVSLVFEGRDLHGTPFEDLGCMGVYRYNYGNLDPNDFYTGTPGGALWSFCSANEVFVGIARMGGPDATVNVQNSLGGKIQFRFQFNTDTDKDGVDDYINLVPNLKIEYTVP
ncbi:MAG: hypothetical protein FJ010_00330 [Chloroflexi bacterium]|nr:hypothetical protein [Chloroflexota bacterium]